MVKSKQKSQECLDKRHHLLGNSWQVGVVGFLISHLGQLLGLIPVWSVRGLVKALTPGAGSQLASVLLRPPLMASSKLTESNGQLLARKLIGLTSVKGEDSRHLVNNWSSLLGCVLVCPPLCGVGKSWQAGPGGGLKTILTLWKCEQFILP